MVKIKLVKVVGQEEEKIFSTARNHNLFPNFIELYFCRFNQVKHHRFEFLISADE